MSSIESLKEQARRHEQKEDWAKALDQYQKAIEELAEAEQPDIGLYNRVGDLFTRIGDNEQAATHYESAVDLYLDSELPNNAIAVCKKILRNLPERHSAFLRMGQIRASQGFLVDARQNFLTYAERVQGEGDFDEAMRALVEFADLAPDDTDIRMAIGLQFQQKERSEEAIEQFARAHAILTAKGDSAAAQPFADKIVEINPDGLESALAGGGMPAAVVDEPEDEGAFGAFGEIDLSGPVDVPGEEAVVAVDMGAVDMGAVGQDEVDMGAIDLGDGFAEISLGDDSEEGADEAEPAEDHGDLPMMDVSDSVDDDLTGLDPEKAAAAAELEEMASAFGSMGTSDADDEAPEGGDLPLMSFDDEDSAEDVGGELPMMSFGDDDSAEDVGGELPMMSFGEDDHDDGDAAPEGGELPLMSFDDTEDELGVADADDALEMPTFGDPSEPDDAPTEQIAEALEESVSFDEPAVPMDPRAQFEALEAEAAESPDDVSLRQRMLEVAYQVNDDVVMASAYFGLANALRAGGNEAKAQAMYQQALSADPEHEGAKAALSDGGPATRPVAEVAASEDYIDLGSMILGDEEEKTTRFVVAYEEPSGDEDADFAKMLSQFKAKVAENFEASDVQGHHDLGTAYKEMGLLDEAIEEFQQALRAAADHLPTYEMLGQTFMDKGEWDAATRVLTRALQVPFEVEDELLGIYYYLGRAHEALGNRKEAAGFYDQVFSLDINFADVTERLRNLR